MKMKKHIIRIYSILWFAIISLVQFPAYASLEIDITQGNVEPLPVALANLVGTTPDEKKLGRDIVQVVGQDLERSGLFRTIDQRAFIDTITSDKAFPLFANWRKINASGLLVGNVELAEEGQLQIEFRIWDVYTERQIIGKSYSTTKENWRRIAHLIADSIYERLTGENGYFDTRIVYIAESGPANKRIKRLAIMDQDGENHSYLTDGSSLVLTPRFSPTTQRVIYMSYEGRRPRVYTYDLETSQKTLLGQFKGMTFAPRFSPSGTRAIMSASINGNSEIYILELSSGKKSRVTYDRAIDTSPSFSPDEEQIVFNSDRGGSQQLYVMDSNGRNVRRISFGEGRYGTPVWSPRGDLIAFTKMLKGKFYIGVMRPDGAGERLLTESYLDEGPTWSPNGRVIMFTRQQQAANALPQIYSIDLTGYNERKIVTPQGASDPAWSPLLTK